MERDLYVCIFLSSGRESEISIEMVPSSEFALVPTRWMGVGDELEITTSIENKVTVRKGCQFFVCVESFMCMIIRRQPKDVRENRAPKVA